MTKKVSKNDDQLVFTEEKPRPYKPASGSHRKFKLLIVDDEKEVHIMTKLVLSDYSYKDHTLHFLSAYSGKEARKLISDHPDAALILLDVVMETKTAGLDVAKFIRKEMNNSKLRIILRTGQPGKAPEKEIILNYDINDYKEKTELTTQKLFTTVTTALRSYLHLQDLEEKNREIASKNNRLNEEIARRLVAESNLTKYNRSLEKMIDSKSERLKKAIQDLAVKEQQLVEANRLAQVGDLSATSFDTLNHAGKDLKSNLDMINSFRLNMTQLLEKYEILQNIITTHAGEPSKINLKANEMINDIDRFKEDIDLARILEKYPDIIKDSARGIKHISKAVTDIKLFVSICDEPFQNTDIEKLLKEVLQKTGQNFSSKINIQTDFDSIPAIPAAPKGLKKAFHEIIKNAFEAVGNRGVISVETLCEDEAMLIHICDNGEGIIATDQDRIFKPYFTTKSGAHRGLGLSFAKSAILSHKGSFYVSSSPKQGTSITVKLPLPA
jgi:two-component system NtrC family sensor kinase